jgi:hypothetical protein
MIVWRLACGAFAAILIAIVPVRAQVGTDRPGGDYASFTVRSGDPAQCAARCERDQRCLAWGFSYPLTEGTSAVCWLKTKVTPRIDAPCCVSGVRGTGVIEPKNGTIEFGVDRFGGDLRHFDMPAGATVKACQQTCENESACRAWTYVRPGYLGQAAVCYLKDRITRPVRKPCCLSGVVR